MDPQMIALQDRLRGRFKPTLVSRPETDLVVEGYPRSGNTFTVDMLTLLTQERLRMAHHLHLADNVRLGAALGKPVVILIRDPESAILSFTIFSGKSVDLMAKRYRAFYQDILAIDSGFCIVTFDEVTGDFNRVVQKINAATGLAIPQAADLPATEAAARARAQRRAKQTHGDKHVLRVGAPTPEREQLKAERRAEVQDYLAQHPDIAHLYDAIRAKA